MRRFARLVAFPLLACALSLSTAVAKDVEPPEIPDLSGLEVSVFTPGGRAFDPFDLLLLSAFELTAKSVSDSPGTSNPDANIKIAKDKAAIGRKLKAHLDWAYNRSFELLLEWEPGDDDVFINLGGKDPDDWAEALAVNFGDAAAKPAGPKPAPVATPVATATTADTGDFPNLAGTDFTIFTPENRAFNDRDRAFMSAVQSKGATVWAEPGGGGSNANANVKVAKDRATFGRRLEAILERTYGWDFTVLTEWEEGSGQVYVNLGTEVSRLCGPGVGLKVGDQVLRGPDWKWEQQDGGPGHLGTVLKPVDEDGWVEVQWENGASNTYRWGNEMKYDIIKAL